MAKKEDRPDAGNQYDQLEKRRKAVESTATFGLLLICVALVVPFASGAESAMLKAFKWVYAAGALIYIIARVVGCKDPRDSRKVLRLRRMEFWAGVAFVVAAAFWFVMDARLQQNPYMGFLAVMRDTIAFTLAGAFIQIIASWLIVARVKKEQKGSADNQSNTLKK